MASYLKTGGSRDGSPSISTDSSSCISYVASERSDGSDISVMPSARSSASDISLMPSGKSNGSVSMFGHLAMLPLQIDASFGSDLSKQEAIQRLQELMRENHDLKNTLRENNIMMKSLQTILMQMKERWEIEQRETMTKFHQAKTIVLALRKDVELKKAKISSLETELKESRSKLDVPVSMMTSSDMEQCKLNLSCMRKEREIQNNEMDNLKIKMEQAQKKAIAINAELQEKIEEAKNLMVDCEHMEHQMSQLAQENRKHLKLLKNAEQERQDLVKANNELLGQMRNLKESLLSSAGVDPDTLATIMKETLVIAEGGSVDSTTHRKYPEDHGTQDDMNQSQSKYEEAGQPEHSNKLDMEDLSVQSEQKHSEKADNDDLSALLEAERAKVLIMTQQIEQLNATLEAYNQEIQSKSESLSVLQGTMDDHVKHIESFHLQKEGELMKELDMLHRQLQHSMGHQSHSPESTENLKAQVMLLLNEVTESNKKHQEACTMVDRFRLKCEELEQEYVAAQDELGSLRSKDDHLIEALRATVADTEKALAAQKVKNEEQNSLIEEYRDKLAEVQKECTTTKYKLEEATSPARNLTPGGSMIVTLSEKRELEERLSRLTAQLITAEDSLLQKQEEMQKLQQKIIILRSESEDIPYLKAQIDSYKVDFEAERNARRQDRQKVGQICEELDAMRLFNQQLQDQLTQLTSLHRRGDMSSGRYSEHNLRSQQYPGGGYDECDPPNGQHTFNRPRSRDRSSEGHRTVEGSGSASDLSYMASPVRQPTEHTLGQMDAAAPTTAIQEYCCPKCGLKTQDIDSLTIHVDDCLKEDASEV